MIEAAMIWNEPNNKSHWDIENDPGWVAFARMAKLAGAAIAGEAPGLPRVLGGMSPIDPDFIRVLQVQGVLEQLDAVAVHGFPLDWNNWLLREWPDKLATIQACTDLPVWVSEVGISTFGAEEVQEWGLKRTAELLIRAGAAHPLVQPLRSAGGVAGHHAASRSRGIVLLPAFPHGPAGRAREPETRSAPFRGLHAGDRAVPMVPLPGSPAGRRGTQDARHGRDVPAHRAELGRFLPSRCAGLVRPSDARAGGVPRDCHLLLHPRGSRNVAAPHRRAEGPQRIRRVLCDDDTPLRAGPGGCDARAGLGGAARLTPAQTVLDGLARRRPVALPVALVAAHPDDETIGAGASLRLFGDLLLIHVTDGAPANLGDARRAGFGTLVAYAAARRAELAAALEAGQTHPRTLALDLPDQGASAEMAALAGRLAAVFAAHGTRVVITHPYEGGHPDHDATALGVHRAVHGTSIEVVEMASYHAGEDGGMATGRFLPGGGERVEVRLTPNEQDIKRAMLACFATQRATLAPFGIEREVFRLAPDYDFARPPHLGELHYERHEWGMTGAAWRNLAAAAIA